MKYLMSKLLLHDKQHNDCIVRELEIEVDSIVPSVGYSIQFWQDVRLYGVDEAILYLKDIVTITQHETIKNKWIKIKERIKPRR